MLNDDMEYLGPVRAKEVQEAQSAIVNAIRNLEAMGEITITRASVEDELID
jgi:flagellar motor switch protein FliG